MADLHGSAPSDEIAADSTKPPDRKRGLSFSSRWLYRSLDVLLVCFAVWTIAYQLAQLPGVPLTPRGVLVVVVVVVLVGAIVAAARASRGSGAQDASLGPSAEKEIPLAVVFAALGAAALSLVANRPDLDDVFYVNRSTAVQQLGEFPLRDTMFSNQLFAMSPGQYPPIASYEALVGVLGGLLQIQAASLTYFVVPPIASFVAVVALWRLLASWDLVWSKSAFGVALLYLIFGGAFHASFGNTWVERMWQGKILFISAVVPLLLVYLARFVRRPTWRNLLLPTVAVVASIGLTSSALFLMAAFLAATAAAAIALGQRYGPTLLLIPGAYLGLVAIYWVSASGELDPTGSPETDLLAGWDIVTKVLGSGPYLVVGLSAWLFGWIAIRRREAQVLVLLLSVGTAIGVSPVGLFIVESIGLPQPIWWRLMWLIPIPPLVGALAAGLATLSRAGFMVPIALGACIVLAGLPIWSPANGVVLGWPSWKWSADTQSLNAELSEVVVPGDSIGAPEHLGGLVASSSARYWSVSPRNWYTTGMGWQDGFCAAERLAVVDYVSGARELDSQVINALERLGVTVLVFEAAAPVEGELSRLGFAPGPSERIVRRGVNDISVAEPQCYRQQEAPAAKP